MKKFKYVNEYAVVNESFDNSIMLKTDEIFLNDNGIVEVSKERWNEAQKYEHLKWMQRGLSLTDDRNFYHLEMFNCYSSIANNNFSSMIELGCGPFTNARIICDVLNVENVTLLDPLLFEYMNHPGCTYHDGKLNNKMINVINSPIEALDKKEQYDIVVMINVLEHCQSIPKIFEKIQEIVKEDGIFIFSDVYFSQEVIKDISKHAYNSGHPIRIEEKYLKNFLSNFDEKYSKIIDEVVAGQNANEIYFIGQNKKRLNK